MINDIPTIVVLCGCSGGGEGGGGRVWNENKVQSGSANPAYTHQGLSYWNGTSS